MVDNSQLNIKRLINSSDFMESNDVMQTKRALEALGYYRVTGGVGSPYPDGPMFEAIGRFQIDHGLPADGKLGPGGATQAAINHCLAHGVNAPAATRAVATPGQAYLCRQRPLPSPGRKAADEAWRGARNEAGQEMWEYRSLARGKQQKIEELNKRLTSERNQKIRMGINKTKKGITDELTQIEFMIKKIDIEIQRLEHLGSMEQ